MSLRTILLTLGACALLGIGYEALVIASHERYHNEMMSLCRHAAAEPIECMKSLGR